MAHMTDYLLSSVRWSRRATLPVTFLGLRVSLTPELRLSMNVLHIGR